MKKSSLLFIIFYLCINSVVTDESVSVIEGDSVTLHTNTIIQKDDTIEWRFGDEQYLIARINGKANLFRINADDLDGRFRDRLKLNKKTGDLTITNITTQHTGLYQIVLIGEKFTKMTFIINVSADKVKTEMMGDSVILHNNVIKKPGDEKMMLRIRHNNSPVAEMNDTVLTYNVNNVRFRDRLQLDYQTGDLTIMNIRPEDSGSYEVDITIGSHTHTIHRSFNVKGGLSPGAIAGMSVFFSLFIAAAVVFYYYLKISQTKLLDEKMTVVAGHRAVLQAGLKELKKDDKIEWRFGQDTEMKDAVIMWPWRSPGTLIAKRRTKEDFNTYNGPDERFGDKLSLDPETGDLIINDVNNKHFGVYQLKFTSGGETSYRRLIVSVIEKQEVDEGESVRLKTEVTDMQRVDLMEWTYRSENRVIAKINPASNIFSTYDCDDGKFRDRLHLDPKTGNLTIDDITWGHRGYYTLKIITDGETYYRRFLLAVKFTTLLVDEGKSVNLTTEVNDIQTVGVMEWRFGETLIAEINPASNIPRTYDGNDDIFKDKLNLNPQTGDLTINDIRLKHDGVYTLKIIRDGKPSYRRIYVSLKVLMLVVNEGKSINLENKFTDIPVQRDDVIEWRFGGTLIAEINPANNIFSTYNGEDDLFRDKLNLNHQTGHLAINDFKKEHKGGYRLKIIRDGETSYKSFILSLYGETEEEVYMTEGESVNLKTDHTDIKRDDVIEWTFNETLIAEINPANNIFRTYNDDLFRYKLELNPQTGDLTINDSREKHGGVYKLKIIRDGKASYRRFKTSIEEDPVRKRGDPVMRKRGGSEWNGGGDSVKTRERDSVEIKMPFLPNSTS